MALLLGVPAIGWVLAYMIAAEIGDIARVLPSPRKLAGYSGLCPHVYQSGERDLRGPFRSKARAICVGRASKQPRCLHPPRLLATATSRAKRGSASSAAPKVAQIDLARRLSEAIWHMLSCRGQIFAPAGATDPLAA